MYKRNKWTEDEISILKIDYENKGLTYLTSILSGHTKDSISKKARSLGLKVDKTIYSYDEQKVVEAVKSSYSYKEVLDKLNKASSGSAYTYLIRYIKAKKIDISHFDSWKNNRVQRQSLSMNEIFQKDSKYKGGTKGLKSIILKSGLLKYECVECNNNGQWNNRILILHLDHKNGVNNDNRLRNLRFLCPNCHSQTETYSGKNNKK